MDYAFNYFSDDGATDWEKYSQFDVRTGWR